MSESINNTDKTEITLKMVDIDTFLKFDMNVYGIPQYIVIFGNGECDVWPTPHSLRGRD